MSETPRAKSLPASNKFRLSAVHSCDMNRTVSFWLSWKIAFAFALVTASAAFAAIPPAEKLLPADTLLMFSVPDAARLRSVYEKSAWNKFWNDPVMRPFREKFMAKWNAEFITPLERELGVKLADYTSLPQGQVTIALTQNGWTGQPGNHAEPGFLFLLDAGTNTAQLKTNLAELRKKWTDAGKALQIEKVREVEFVIVPMSSNDVPATLKSFAPQKQEVQELGKEKPKPAAGWSLAIGQFESLLIAASSPKVADGVVARLTGGNAPALADDPPFEQNRLVLFRDAGFFGWVNARTAMDLLLKLPRAKPNPEAPNPQPPPEMHDVISGLGLGGLKTAALVFRDTGEGTAFEIFLGAPEATREGFLKLMTPEAKDASPPPFVPADALKFQRLRLPAGKSVATFEKMLKEVSPQTFESWQYLIKNGEEAMRQTNPNFDTRRDLFAGLGDDFFTYEKAPRSTSPAELNSPPSLFAIAAPDAERLVRALPALLIIRASDALTPKVREFLGKRIYSVSLGAGGGGPGATGPGERLSYAASAGYVVFSTDAATLEEFLRCAENPGRPLREAAGLADAAQRVGGMSTGMFSYENQAETMRLMFELFRKLTPDTPAPAGSGSLASALPFSDPEKSFRDWLDFSLLPEFSKVARYFSFSVWSGSTTAEGLSFKWFSPAPPGLKQ